jgi:predicted secreted hydrolase
VLTAFRLRRREGHPAGVALWAGGSWRSAGGSSRSFAPGAVNFIALKSWTSPRQGRSGPVRYPVHWRIETPAGNFLLQALLDDQEIDGRASTGTLYWEGLSELLDAGSGRRIGLGYLEMTGYADRPGV